MTPAEKQWLWRITLILLAVTTLPILFGFWYQDERWRFTGFFLGVGDGNSYIAKMLLGTNGEWLFRTPYTAYPQNGFLAFLPYLLLGKLASFPGGHEQLVVLFQIFRWIGGGVMVYGTYRFFGHFFEDVRTRRFCTILAVLGGGAGWLALVGLAGIWGGRIPLEFYSPETFGFISFFTLPHLAAARGLLLWGLVRYWESVQNPPSNQAGIMSGILWFFLGLMQPLTGLVGWGIIALDLGIRFILRYKTHHELRLEHWKPVLRYLATAAVFSMPLLLYSSLAFLTDNFLSEWSRQNIIQSPPPGDYLMAYLFMIPWMGIGAWQILKNRQERFYPLVGWILLIPVLAYFPVMIQRRLPEGSWVAIIAVAALGLAALKPRWQAFARFGLISGLISALFLLLGSFLTLSQRQEPVYRPTEEVQVFDTLRQVAKPSAVVLASFDTSNALPAWAQVRTLTGHGPESIHLKEIQPRAEGFYRTDLSQAQEGDFLRQFSIQYVIWGPAERELGDRDLGADPNLRVIFQNTAYQVFEVVK